MRTVELGKRQTSQRRAILRALRAADGPLTVHEILERAQGLVPKLGIATVYRTVHLLLEVGRIASVTLPDGEPRYEIAQVPHHCHFRCRTCGRVYALPLCASAVADGTLLPSGFLVEGHSVALHGLCTACAAAVNLA